MDQRYMIMTVDTEGDDLWHWKQGQIIGTENAGYVGRFQTLCEKYALPPVYLINYEMALSDTLRNLLVGKAKEGLCEIGMHVHAWNSPPDYQLNGSYGAQPYITEYPENIILEKHRFLKELIRERFGQTPVSYRSGRWATNEALWNVLSELGFLVDCSVAPGINLKTPGRTVDHGPDYTESLNRPYYIRKNLLEVPMTTARRRSLNGKNLKRKAKNLIKGEELWLRPIFGDPMLNRLVSIARNENRGYLEIMVHSSELMPGGSPYITTQDQLENLYAVLERLLKTAVMEGYRGITLQAFAGIFKEQG